MFVETRFNLLVFNIFYFLSAVVMIGKSYSALLYMLLSGIFGALTLVLLVAFLVMVVCLCIHHRKRRTGNKCIGMHILIIINSKCSLLASFPSPPQLIFFQAEPFSMLQSEWQAESGDDSTVLPLCIKFPIGISLAVLTRSLYVT